MKSRSFTLRLLAQLVGSVLLACLALLGVAAALFG